MVKVLLERWVLGPILLTKRPMGTAFFFFFFKDCDGQLPIVPKLSAGCRCMGCKQLLQLDKTGVLCSLNKMYSRIGGMPGFVLFAAHFLIELILGPLLYYFC